MSSRGGDAITTVPLRKATRDRLKQQGAKGETYDAILNRLLDAVASPHAQASQRALSEPRPLVDFEPIETDEPEG